MRRLPPLRLLNVLDAVVRCGGTKQASAELNVSQPAVSQSLKQLEHFVGLPLLDRRTRPSTLTPAGSILANAAHIGISALETAMTDIENLSRFDTGAITVSCTLGYATYWLMPRLHDFHESHPGLNVNVQSVYQGQPGFEAGADVALRFGDGDWRDSETHLLFDESITATCSQRYLLENGPFESVAALHRADLIHVDPVDAHWYDWPRFFRELDATPTAPLGGKRFNNYVQAVQATVAGEGIMLGWIGVTGQIGADNSLVPAISESVDPKSGFYVCTAGDRTVRPAVSAFVDWVIGQVD